MLMPKKVVQSKQQRDWYPETNGSNDEFQLHHVYEDSLVPFALFKTPNKVNNIKCETMIVILPKVSD